MKLYLLTFLVVSFCFGKSIEKEINWGYKGKTGPQYWGNLSPEFSLCNTGKNQSPINLTNMIEANLKPLKFDYKQDSFEILHNGHTIQVNYKAGSTLLLEGNVFELKQFHFHSPSENKIEGESFPLEVHFVHMNQNNEIVVVTVMFREGDKNEELAKIWNKIPKYNQSNVSNSINGINLMPKVHDYYRFDGSLTTPPCSEGVTWIVLKNVQTVSKEQIETFLKAMGGANNRPILPINDRIILK